MIDMAFDIYWTTSSFEIWYFYIIYFMEIIILWGDFVNNNDNFIVSRKYSTQLVVDMVGAEGVAREWMLLRKPKEKGCQLLLYPHPSVPTMSTPCSGSPHVLDHPVSWVTPCSVSPRIPGHSMFCITEYPGSLHVLYHPVSRVTPCSASPRILGRPMRWITPYLCAWWVT